MSKALRDRGRSPATPSFAADPRDCLYIEGHFYPRAFRGRAAAPLTDQDIKGVAYSASLSPVSHSNSPDDVVMATGEISFVVRHK